jgi:hypothetical protein
MIDDIKLSTAIDFACKDLKSLITIDKYLDFLNTLSILNFRKIRSDNFADIPTPNTSLNNREKIYFTPVDLIEFELTKDSIGNKLVVPTKVRSLYMNTINGPWIAIDTQNQDVTNRILGTTFGMGRFEHIGKGYFKYLIQPHFLKVTYFSDCNKFMAMISTNIEDLDHPIYSWNKIIDYLC